jgi:hypothetical protein
MPQYRVLQRSFINNAILEEGAVIEFDGEPGPNLEPIKVDKAAKGAKGGRGKAQGDEPQGGDAEGNEPPAGDGGDLV